MADSSPVEQPDAKDDDEEAKHAYAEEMGLNAEALDIVVQWLENQDACPAPPDPTDTSLVSSDRPHRTGRNTDSTHLYVHNFIPKAIPNKEFKITRTTTEERRQIFFHDPNKKKKDDRVIFFEGKISQISGIDLKNETFNATVRIYIMWLATEEDVQNYQQVQQSGDKKEWVPTWVPQCEVDNYQSGKPGLKPDTTKLIVASDYFWLKSVIGPKSSLGFDARFGVWVRAMYEFDNTFVEEFELQSFPFDCQDLKIVLRVKNCKRVAPLPTTAVYLSFNPFRSTLADFKVATVGGEFGMSSPEGSRGGKVYGDIALVVKVIRDWKSRLDVIISTATLTFLSLAVFALEPQADTNVGDLGNRINYLMTLILTDVALQQNVTSQLDDFEYFTALDTFIWSSFFFKAAVVVWVVTPNYPIFTISYFANAEQTNIVATWVFVISYFIWIFCSFGYFAVLRHVEKRKLHKSILQLEAEYLQEHSVFELMIDDKLYENLVEAQHHGGGKEDTHYKRLVQYGETKKTAIGLNRDEEYRKYDATYSRQDIFFQMVGIKGGLIFPCVLLIATWVMNRFLLANEFLVHIFVIYIIALLGNVLDLTVVIVKRANHKYAHSIWFQLEAFLAAGVSIATTVVSPRAFWMSVLVMIWTSANLVFELVYGLYFTCALESPDKDRLGARYIRIYNVWNKKVCGDKPEHKPSGTQNENENDAVDDTSCYTKSCWFQAKLVKTTILKHLGIAVQQGFRAFVVLLPMFVVQRADKRHIIHNKRTPDTIGFIVAIAAFAIFLISAIFVDPVSAFKEVMTLAKIRESITELPGKCCLACNNLRNGREARFHFPSEQERLGQALRVADEDSEATEVEVVPHQAMVSRSSSSARPRGEEAESTESVEQTSLLNPYGYARFPMRTSEMLFFTALWIVSWSVYTVYVAAMIAILSPVVVVVYHSVFEVPLIERCMDDAFGEDPGYQVYKDNTNWFLPVSM